MPLYATHVSTKQTPQSEVIPGKPMVQNNAGGFVFSVDNWQRLDRFLILGSCGGSYYTTERKLTQENATAVVNCIKADGKRTVARIAEISDAGRAPKNDPAIFALALAATHGDDEVKREAFAALPKVCRIGTHLFQFAASCNELRGWGRGLRKAIANWYASKSADQLAYQVVKYQQRDGWSHRDLLRLSHPIVDNAAVQAVLRWAVRGSGGLGEVTFSRRVKNEKRPTNYPAVGELPEAIQAFEAIKKATDAKRAAELIRKHRIVRECVPTQFLTDAGVWDALLAEMPMTAMLRNLATMTKVGLLSPLSDAVRNVCAELTDVERLKKGRIHPLSLLVAMKTYGRGRGVKGDSTWTPVQAVVDALDAAFYLAFKAIEPTGKRHLLALDVSGSMSSANIAGLSSITAREASTAMALVTAATEANHHIVGFTSNGAFSRQSMHSGYPSGISPVAISPQQRLDEAVRTVASLPMGDTDCALPMLYAMESHIPVDTFIIYTDNETWHGTIHPIQALKQYRDLMGIAAKLIVVGMTATEFSIADPADFGSLDVVGFDTAAPAVMADFVRN